MLIAIIAIILLFAATASEAYIILIQQQKIYDLKEQLWEMSGIEPIFAEVVEPRGDEYEDT